MPGWSPRQTVALGTIALAILVALVVGFVRHGADAEQGFVLERAPAIALAQPAPQPPAVASAAPASPKELVVHVAGRVKKPGVYRLKPGARAVDAIKAAGGPLADANQDAVNLAALVEDGQQLYLPSRKERPTGGAAVAVASTRDSSKRAAPAGSAKAARNVGRGATIVKLTQPGAGTVDLNLAGSDELQRLPGVGPAMAQRILDYRKEIGRFSSIEQLTDVSGIGEKKFARMKPFVRVR